MNGTSLFCLLIALLFTLTSDASEYYRLTRWKSKHSRLEIERSKSSPNLSKNYIRALMNAEKPQTTPKHPLACEHKSSGSHLLTRLYATLPFKEDASQKFYDSTIQLFKRAEISNALGACLIVAALGVVVYSNN